MSSVLIRFFVAGALALSFASPALAQKRHHSKNESRTAAAVVGGLLVGAAVLAASSRHHRHRHHYESRRAVRASHAPFSPAPRITCYPAQRSCYRANGRYAPRWTRRLYR